MKYLLLGLGGALGTIIRYFISTLNQSINSPIPFGTLTVNLLGSFLIGVSWGYFGNGAHHHIKHFLFIGFFGGFTTFSTFAFENYDLVKNGSFPHALFYISISCILGITLAWIGITLGKFLRTL